MSPKNSRRVTKGSWLWKLGERMTHPPGSFTCGIRVLSGEVSGEGRRWSYRLSAADELVSDGIVTIQHGRESRLRLRLVSSNAERGTRPGHAIVSAVEVDSMAQIEVSLPAGELVRFGIQ